MDNPPTPEHQFNVEDFGAVGDGVTDDTAAIRRALKAAPNGSRVKFKPATYAVGTIYLKRGE